MNFGGCVTGASNFTVGFFFGSKSGSSAAGGGGGGLGTGAGDGILKGTFLTPRIGDAVGICATGTGDNTGNSWGTALEIGGDSSDDDIGSEKKEKNRKLVTYNVDIWRNIKKYVQEKSLSERENTYLLHLSKQWMC